MENKKSKKTIIAGIGLVILLIFLVFILGIYFTKEKRTDRKLNTYAKKFYTYYYKEQKESKGSDKLKSFLSNYSEIGLTMKLKDLKIYLDTHKIENYSLFKECDEDKTKVTVYPISPYGENDYRVETKLECNTNKKK